MTMKPSELSKNLAKIASRIDASKNPSKSAVAADLKKLVVAMEQSQSQSQDTGSSQEFTVSQILSQSIKDQDAPPGTFEQIVKMVKDYCAKHNVAHHIEVDVLNFVEEDWKNQV